MHVSEPDLQAVSRLWRELSEFPASRPHEARLHGLSGLGRIIGASNVLWVGATRNAETPPANDLLKGWRPKAVAHLHADPALARLRADMVRQMHRNVADPMSVANVAWAGATRAFLRPELVVDDVWARSTLVNELLRPAGVADRIIGVHPVDERRESHICVDRAPGERLFGDRERDLLHLFLTGAPGFHREQFMAHGLPNAPLSPRERDVLGLLLTDRSERQIAEALGLTWRTTHQYAVSVFKKFGVRGRFGLMAYWLRHGGPPAT
jgi:DNA-binding CsgD family transcriptional regulator